MFLTIEYFFKMCFLHSLSVLTWNAKSLSGVSAAWQCPGSEQVCRQRALHLSTCNKRVLSYPYCARHSAIFVPPAKRWKHRQRCKGSNRDFFFFCRCCLFQFCQSWREDKTCFKQAILISLICHFSVSLLLRKHPFAFGFIIKKLFDSGLRWARAPGSVSTPHPPPAACSRRRGGGGGGGEGGRGEGSISPRLLEGLS